MTYQINLSGQELLMLEQILREEIAGLHEELRHTDSRQYKTSLQQRLALTESLLETVNKTKQTVPVPT